MKRQTLFTAIGLSAAITAGAYLAINVSAQKAPVTDEAVDFRNVATAELRDSGGQAILAGPFALVPEEDDDIERKATMKPAGADADATGIAEVEFAKDKANEQEVEFAGKNLQSGATYTLMFDGRRVTSGVANDKGELEIEAIVRLPGSSSGQ